MNLDATAATDNPSVVVRHRIIHMFIHNKFSFSTVPDDALEVRADLLWLL